jgi:acetyltransferase-like isoleucine patch superfamily enzyme
MSIRGLPAGKPAIGKLVSLYQRSVFALARLGPDGDAIRDTQGTQVPIDFERWYAQRVLGINNGAYWPVHRSSTISYANRIHIGIETSPGWSAGCLINGQNGIAIGDYTQISQNVAILSANHDPYSLPEHPSAKPIRIGRYCLLGFNSVVLPEVELGDYTIVGANAVVRHSFTDGYCVLAGAPAKVVTRLDPALARNYRSEKEYHGYIKAADFPAFANARLSPL